MTDTAYSYEATRLNGVWMVKRTKGDGTWDEAEIWVGTSDPQVAIEAAIKRGSWG